MIVEEKLNALFVKKNLKEMILLKNFINVSIYFIKECLKSWLKRSNVCPLCKNDLTEDINKIHL